MKKIYLVNIYPLDYPGGLEIFCRAFISLELGDVNYIYSTRYFIVNKIKFLSLAIVLFKCLRAKWIHPNSVFILNGLTSSLAFAFKNSISVFHGANAEIINNHGLSLIKRIYYLIEIIPIEWLGIRFSKNCIFVSERCKNQFIKYYDVKVGVVIPNPILNDFLFQSNPYDDFKSFYNILYFGRWELQKGIDTIEVLAANLNPNKFKIHIISPTKEIHSSNPIFNFHGSMPHEKIGDYLLHCDAVVLPSKSEGFGYAILESTLLARLVLTNSVGIAPDLVLMHKNLKIMNNHNSYIKTLMKDSSTRTKDVESKYPDSRINVYNKNIANFYSDALDFP